MLVTVYNRRKSRYMFPRDNFRFDECLRRFSTPLSVKMLPEDISVELQELQDKVIGIVSEQLSVEKDDITLKSSFVDDLKADSLDLVEVVMEFEDEFEITIPDDDYEKIKTVGDAVTYIKDKS